MRAKKVISWSVADPLFFFFPLPHLAVKYCFFFRIIFPNYRLALNYYITDYTTTEKIKRNPI